MSRTSLVLAAGGTLLLAASATQAQVAGGTAQIGPEGPGLADVWQDATPAITDALAKGATGKGVEEYGGLLRDEASELGEVTDTFERRGGDSKITAEAKGEIDKLNKKADWLAKAKKVLDIIDIVSTAAKTAGYLVEGDPTGATHVVVSDIAKKTAEALGAAGLTWIPGGQIAGAYLGEQFHQAYVQPLLDANEARVRDEQYAAKYANKPWLPENLYLKEDGSVVRLDDDMYYDFAKGLTVRRSPQEQAAYEATKLREWQEEKRLLDFSRQFAKGQISEEQFDAVIADYKDRDRTKEWNPEPSQFGIESGSETETAAVEEEPQEKTLLDLVEPQKVTANISFHNEAVTWTYYFTFWNVGAKVPGYGEANAVLVIEDKKGTKTLRGSGTFSGGPDGVLKFREDSTPIHLHDGRTFTYKTVAGKIGNPQVFDNWPEAFR